MMTSDDMTLPAGGPKKKAPKTQAPKKPAAKKPAGKRKKAVK